MASLVTIATYYDHNEALVAKSILEQHGFTVFLHDGFYTSVNWGHLFAVGGVRLAVPNPEAAEAVHLLSDRTPLPLEQAGAIDRCPDCGSQNVARTPHWLSVLLSLYGIFAAGTIALAPSKFRRCRDCKHRWRI